LICKASALPRYKPPLQSLALLLVDSFRSGQGFDLYDKWKKALLVGNSNVRPRERSPADLGTRSKQLTSDLCFGTNVILENRDRDPYADRIPKSRVLYGSG
jgi:hypothetical protein